MRYVRLSFQNRIVLPKEAREAMGVRGGDYLVVVVKGDVAILKSRPRRYTEALRGRGKGSLESLLGGALGIHRGPGRPPARGVSPEDP